MRLETTNEKNNDDVLEVLLWVWVETKYLKAERANNTSDKLALAPLVAPEETPFNLWPFCRIISFDWTSAADDIRRPSIESNEMSTVVGKKEANFSLNIVLETTKFDWRTVDYWHGAPDFIKFCLVLFLLLFFSFLASTVYSLF